MRFKRIKYMLFALICMCVTPLITHAECDYQRQAELSRLASNVQLTYTYSQENGFEIIMTNLTNDLYAVDMYGQIISGGAERTFNYASGSYSFDIYSNDSACRGESLLRKSINLPTMNEYSYYDECKQYPNFKYCQVWGSFSIDQDQFMTEFEQYKTSVEDKKNESVEKENGVFEVVFDILKNNLFMFIFLGCVILLTIIVVNFKKRHK